MKLVHKEEKLGNVYFAKGESERWIRERLPFSQFLCFNETDFCVCFSKNSFGGGNRVYFICHYKDDKTTRRNRITIISSRVFE